LRRFDDILNYEKEVCLDHCSEASKYMYKFRQKWLYNLLEFEELGCIDSLLENSEADAIILNSHRAHGGYEVSTEDAYSF
jgi:hypothetical protein